MHKEAMDWVAQHADDGPVIVLDIGGRDLNGSPRHLFPNAIRYDVLDIEPGPNVNIVADATAPVPRDKLYATFYDIVVCTEVLEHVENWPWIIKTAHRALCRGGKLILTCAGPGRFPHSGREPVPTLAPGEWYRNIPIGEIEQAFVRQQWRSWTLDVLGTDCRAMAVK